MIPGKEVGDWDREAKETNKGCINEQVTVRWRRLAHLSSNSHPLLAPESIKSPAFPAYTAWQPWVFRLRPVLAERCWRPVLEHWVLEGYGTSLTVNVAISTGIFERPKSQAGKKKKKGKRKPWLSNEGSKERLHWVWFYFHVIFFFVFVLFLMGLMIYVTDQASLFSHLL